MNRKGQGALEYLLLIGGAVLVAVIVITLLLNISGDTRTDTEATVDAAAIQACEARLGALCPGMTQTAIDNACAADTSETTCS